MAIPSRPLAGRVDRMSEANAVGVGGLFLLQASKSPPTRLASLATLPATAREGKGQRAHQQMCASPSPSVGKEGTSDLMASAPAWGTGPSCAEGTPDAR